MNVYILNLEVEQKRRYMCEGALFAMNAPFKRVKRWVAKDDFEYEKSSDVIRAAIRDGFPSFQSYLDKGQQNKDGIAIYTQTWNYCRFWRYLVENNETAMLIQDDRRLRVSYPRMLEIFQELISFDPDVEFLSLWCNQEVAHKSFSDRLPFRFISEDSPIAYGIYENGACAGHIVTPTGAKVLLDIVPGFFPPRAEHGARVEYAVSKQCVRRDHFYTLVDETQNITHLVADNRSYLPPRIISGKGPDGYVRPIHTTSD